MMAWFDSSSGHGNNTEGEKELKIGVEKKN